MIPIATGDGSPRTAESVATKTAARNEIKIWLPINEPIRAIIALVKSETRGRRVVGTNRSPSSVTCGSDVRK